MEKFKKFFKWLAIGCAIIAAWFYFDGQDKETKNFYAIIGVMIYLGYLADARLKDYFKDRETKYFCTYELDVIAHDSDKVVASFEINYFLPFPPFPGLSVSGEKNPMKDDSDPEAHDFEEFYVGKITNVGWRGRGFLCKVEPHKMTESNDLSAVLADHIYWGWKMSGWYFDNKKLVEDYLSKLEQKIEGASTDDKFIAPNNEYLQKVRRRMKRS